MTLYIVLVRLCWCVLLHAHHVGLICHPHLPQSCVYKWIKDKCIRVMHKMHRMGNSHMKITHTLVAVDTDASCTVAIRCKLQPHRTHQERTNFEHLPHSRCARNFKCVCGSVNNFSYILRCLFRNGICRLLLLLYIWNLNSQFKNSSVCPKWDSAVQFRLIWIYLIFVL